MIKYSSAVVDTSMVGIAFGGSLDSTELDSIAYELTEREGALFAMRYRDKKVWRFGPNQWHGEPEKMPRPGRPKGWRKPKPGAEQAPESETEEP